MNPLGRGALPLGELGQNILQLGPSVFVEVEQGGQVIGDSGSDGMSIEGRKVSVSDFLATVCRALGIDPMKQNMSNVGRPIRIVDKAARPIEEVLA